MRKPRIKLCDGYWRVYGPDLKGWDSLNWQEVRAMQRASLWCVEANIQEGRYRGLLPRT